MEKKIIDTIDITGGVDHITKNNDNLRKAIKTMPIGTLDKIDLDNNITDNIKSLDKNIHNKVNDKIKNNTLTHEQEIKLDGVVNNLANETNNLVSNMINSLDQSFPNNEFLDLESKGINEITNIVDGIKYYEKKKVNNLSESEKLLASNDIGGFANTYKKDGTIGGMIMSVFK